MESHYRLSDEKFEQQFAEAKLKAAFTHEAHMRLAYIHIKRYGVAQAIDNICTQILQYARSKNAESNYNKTLTVAAVKVVNHFILRSPTLSFKALLKEHPRLKTNFKGLLQAHYGIDIFTSEKAKKEYIAPDLVPFD